MKTIVSAAFILLIFVMPTFAADGERPPKAAGPNFEARKAEILKNIEERIERLQQMKICIQAAVSREDVRACREKYAPKRDRKTAPSEGSGGE